MHILITGGAGYVGSMVVPLLLGKGHRVRVLDALMFGGESLLSVYGHPSFELCVGDVRVVKDVAAAAAGVDVVIHLAALVGEPACAVDRHLTESINFDGACRALEAARASGAARFVFLSTCSNYGVQSEPASEDSPLKPLSLYSETKVRAEQHVLAASGSGGVGTTVVRLATVFGLSARMRFNLLINQLTRQAVVEGKLSVYGSDAWRPYMHVRDAARALSDLSVAESGLVDGQVLNVGTENLRKVDITEIIRNLVPSVQLDARASESDPRDYRVSFDRFRLMTHFQPQHTVSSGIAEIVSALRRGLFVNPSEPKYDIWLDQPRLQMVGEVIPS